MAQTQQANIRPMTLGEKLKRRIYITKIVVSLVSMGLYTAFTVVMLYRNWGSTVYNSIILGFVGVYILLFVLYVTFSLLANTGGRKLSRSFKDYKSGLKILNSLLRLLSFVLTLSIFAATALSKMISTPFQLAVMLASVLWAMLQIYIQITKIRRRHRAKTLERQPKSRRNMRAAIKQAVKRIRLSKSEATLDENQLNRPATPTTSATPKSSEIDFDK